jgi:hypothetical protein
LGGRYAGIVEELCCFFRNNHIGVFAVERRFPLAVFAVVCIGGTPTVLSGAVLFFVCFFLPATFKPLEHVHGICCRYRYFSAAVSLGRKQSSSKNVHVRFVVWNIDDNRFSFYHLAAFYLFDVSH